MMGFLIIDDHPLFGEALGNAIRISHPDARIYETDADELLKVVKEAPRSVHNLLLAGHNPSLAALASLLMASGDVDARQRLIEKFPTAALAVIDFPLDDWSKIHPKSGRLDRFVLPKALDSETA